MIQDNVLRRLQITAFAITTLALAACGGSGSSAGSDSKKLTVLSTTPMDQATGVDRNTSLTATFSEDIQPGSIDSFQFTLQSPTWFVPASVSPLDDTATLTPDNTLALLTPYTVTLSADITGLTRGALGADTSWRFVTADGNWGTAALIETDNAGGAFDPQIAMDSNGNAVAVWQQWDGARYNILANRYTAGSGWGTAELIETDNAGSAFGPQIAMDPIGNALAVWRQYDGTRDSIWANRYTVGSGWGTAELIETDNVGSAHSPQIAMDTNGNALAVWVQYDGTRDSIWANRFTAGSSWGTAALIETDNAGSAALPHIAMDPNGNALAVWRQSDGTRFNIWANRYTVGSGWGTVALIETDNAGDAQYPQVAMDPNGNAVAVWPQSDGTRLNIWANRYTAGSGWGTAGLIESDNAGDASNPHIAIDLNGNVVAVWGQYDGVRYNILANRYTVGSGWGTAGLIETDNVGPASEPHIAMDSNGNALAVWQQWDGARYNILANRYTVGGSWGTAALIEADNTGYASNPRIAIDPSGNALAVWRQYDGSRTNIWANRLQ